MTNDKQTVHFDMYYNQGYTCIGCAMIADLPIDIEFTNDEIATMRQLVSKVDEVDYSEGIMPVLKDEAPNSTTALMMSPVQRFSNSSLKTASFRAILSLMKTSSIATSRTIWRMALSNSLPATILMKANNLTKSR